MRQGQPVAATCYPVSLRCPRCQATLISDQYCKCLACGHRWPIIGGIPRFFADKDYYWGEAGHEIVVRSKAGALLDKARSTSWKEAVVSELKNPDLVNAVLDLSAQPGR